MGTWRCHSWIISESYILINTFGDETVDDTEEVEQDDGAVRAIATHNEEVSGWMNETARTHRITGHTG